MACLKPRLPVQVGFQSVFVPPNGSGCVAPLVPDCTANVNVLAQERLRVRVSLGERERERERVAWKEAVEERQFMCGSECEMVLW